MPDAKLRETAKLWGEALLLGSGNIALGGVLMTNRQHIFSVTRYL